MPPLMAVAAITGSLCSGKRREPAMDVARLAPAAAGRGAGRSCCWLVGGMEVVRKTWLAVSVLLPAEAAAVGAKPADHRGRPPAPANMPLELLLVRLGAVVAAWVAKPSVSDHR